MLKALLVALLFPFVAVAQDMPKRVEVGALFTYVFLEEIGTRDVGVGTGAGGFGGRFVYNRQWMFSVSFPF